MFGLVDLAQGLWFTTDGKNGEVSVSVSGNEEAVKTLLDVKDISCWFQTTDDDYLLSQNKLDILPFSDWCPFRVSLNQEQMLSVIKGFEIISQYNDDGNDSKNNKCDGKLEFLSHFTHAYQIDLNADIKPAFTLIEKLFSVKNPIEKGRKKKKMPVIEIKEFFSVIGFIAWLLKKQGNVPLWTSEYKDVIECKMALSEILSLPDSEMSFDKFILLRVVDFPQAYFPENLQQLNIARYGIEMLPIDVFRRLFDSSILLVEKLPTDKQQECAAILSKEYTVRQYVASDYCSLIDFAIPIGQEFRLSKLSSKELFLSNMLYLAHFYQHWQSLMEIDNNNGKGSKGFELFRAILLCFHLDNIKAGAYANFEGLKITTKQKI